MEQPASDDELPYIGPSRVPLRSVYELIEAGHWTAPPEPRDTSGDMTEDERWALV